MLRSYHLPRKTSRRIVNKMNEGSPFVVVPGRQGNVTLWSIPSYIRQQKNAQIHRPWTMRRRKASVLGPIGSQALGVRGSLSRSEIYEAR